MDDIEKILRLSNKDHAKLSGAARFWVFVAIMLNIVLPILLIIVVLAVALWK